MLEGKKAKAFCLLNQNEENVCLKDFETRVVLYFYPRDDTPGCTIEANDFTSLVKEFKKQKTQIIGVSKDTTKSHKKFYEKHDLNITLLSDPDFKVHKLFGAHGKKKFMGREYFGTIRSTIIIDKDKKIIKHFDKVSAKGHAQEVLEFIKHL
jgi:thioredoxin-dependent peroxiredoxin